MYEVYFAVYFCLPERPIFPRGHHSGDDYKISGVVGWTCFLDRVWYGENWQWLRLIIELIKGCYMKAGRCLRLQSIKRSGLEQVWSQRLETIFDIAAQIWRKLCTSIREDILTMDPVHGCRVVPG